MNTGEVKHGLLQELFLPNRFQAVCEGSSDTRRQKGEPAVRMVGSTRSLLLS